MNDQKLKEELASLIAAVENHSERRIEAAIAKLIRFKPKVLKKLVSFATQRATQLAGDAGALATDIDPIAVVQPVSAKRWNYEHLTDEALKTMEGKLLLLVDLWGECVAIETILGRIPFLGKQPPKLIGESDDIIACVDKTANIQELAAIQNQVSLKLLQLSLDNAHGQLTYVQSQIASRLHA